MIPTQPWKLKTLGGLVFASVLGPRLENDSDSRDSSDIRVRLATRTPGILAHARYNSIAGVYFRIVPAPASVVFVVLSALAQWGRWLHRLSWLHLLSCKSGCVGMSHCLYLRYSVLGD